MYITVSLKEFKDKVKLALAAAAVQQMGMGLDGMMLKVTKNKLRISAAGGSLSLTQSMDLMKGPQNSETYYLAYGDAKALTGLHKTKDDKLVLETGDGVLSYGTQKIGGTKVLATPTMQVDLTERGTAWVRLETVKDLAQAIKLACEIKVGWKAAERPFTADFVRFTVQATPQEVEMLQGYQSGLTLSVFTTDGDRHFQTFRPMFKAGPIPETPLLQSILLTRDLFGYTYYIEIPEALVLYRILASTDNSMYVDVLPVDKDDPRPRWLLFRNRDLRVRVKLSLSDVPSEEYDAIFAALLPESVIWFENTTAVRQSLGRIIGRDDTKKHGLSLRVENGKLWFSSPEFLNREQFSIDCDAEQGDAAFAIIHGPGVASALAGMGNTVRVLFGEGFVTFEDHELHTRVILYTYKVE